ncbi:MAG: hypothetical protein IIC01_07555, partial [Planctomycetes bacterium]|nr:hypothetical protein [Planctomycetota bacterium]
MTSDPSHQRNTLAKKRREWLACLSGEDVHSVYQQIYAMMWDAASFHVINQAVRVAPPVEGGGIQLSGLLYKLLYRCFFDSQMISIRRQADSSGLTGERGVFSLAVLIRDMCDNAALFTRRQIFDAEGLAYDTVPLREAERRHAAEQHAAGEMAWFVPPDIDAGPSETRHEQIDRLAGVGRGKRSPKDRVLNTVFENLLSKLNDSCRDIKEWVDKFLAHSATPESRRIAKADDVEVTLGAILNAQESICQIASFVSINLLGDSQLCPLA